MTNEIELTAARILGDWAMMLVEPESNELGTTILELEESLFAASLHFTGLISGKYVVLCPRSFATVLAQNLLCGDEVSNDEELFDALKEMVNVFSGNLLTSTYGSHEVFTLTSPEAKEITRAEAQDLISRKVLWMRGDGEPVGVIFIPESVNL